MAAEAGAQEKVLTQAGDAVKWRTQPGKLHGGHGQLVLELGDGAVLDRRVAGQHAARCGICKSLQENKVIYTSAACGCVNTAALEQSVVAASSSTSRVLLRRSTVTETKSHDSSQSAL